MRLDVRCLALASTAVFGAMYLVCFGLYTLAQGPMMAAASYVLHLDLTGTSRFITWGSFFAGLVFWTVLPAAVAATFGWFYNRLLDQPAALAVRSGRRPA